MVTEADGQPTRQSHKPQAISHTYTTHTQHTQHAAQATQPHNHNHGAVRTIPRQVTRTIQTQSSRAVPHDTTQHQVTWLCAVLNWSTNTATKRWRSDTLHPESPVPTTTPPQLRWRAGVLRALRPFRRLRDTQSDPSERVKRSRLALAQVMSTAVAKHCDWSLGFDERGPVFDGTQDCRHSVFLTGPAARKEVYFSSESPENQRLLLAAVEREWKKWEEHKATLPLTQGELRMLKSRLSNLEIGHALGFLTAKEPDFKARLVVQSFQEDPSMMRTDSPTGSRGSFFLVLSCAAQDCWSCGSAHAASAYLQAGGIVLMMPKRQPPPGCEPGEVRVARGSFRGTRDAGRSWYQHFRYRLVDKFRVHESASEKGLYLYEFNGRLTFLSRSSMLMIFCTHMTLITKPPSRCWMPL